MKKFAYGFLLAILISSAWLGLQYINSKAVNLSDKRSQYQEELTRAYIEDYEQKEKEALVESSKYSDDKEYMEAMESLADADNYKYMRESLISGEAIVTIAIRQKWENDLDNDLSEHVFNFIK